MNYDVVKKLSKREEEVLQQLFEGVGVKNIANNLSIKPNTVSTIKKNAFFKLNVTNIIQAYLLMAKK